MTVRQRLGAVVGVLAAAFSVAAPSGLLFYFAFWLVVLSVGVLFAGAVIWIVLSAWREGPRDEPVSAYSGERTDEASQSLVVRAGQPRLGVSRIEAGVRVVAGCAAGFLAGILGTWLVLSVVGLTLHLVFGVGGEPPADGLQNLWVLWVTLGGGVVGVLVALAWMDARRAESAPGPH